MLTEKQKAERLKGIGGSEAAAVCGISSWKTPLDVYLEKIGERIEATDNRYIYWGNRLEDIIGEEYAIRNNVQIVKPEGSAFHPVHTFMRASYDFLVPEKNAALEVKTADSRTAHKWGDEGTDHILTEYLLQIAHYRIVGDFDYVDLAVLIGGNDFRTYRYLKNEALEAKLIKKESNFWNNHVLERSPPFPSSLKEAYQMWPDDNGEHKVVDHENREIFEKIKTIRDSIKSLEKEEEVCKEQICTLLKDASLLLDFDGTRLATWKTQHVTRFDTTAFKEKNPDLYNEFCKKTQSRVLRIS